MSREERRAYQRMMKGSDRTPRIPPAAQVRLDRAKARREARQAAGGPAFTRRFWILATLVAGFIGLMAFSTQWPEMPFAAYVGLGVTALILGVLVGLRGLQRRGARN